MEDKRFQQIEKRLNEQVDVRTGTAIDYCAE
jgi:hypothetical protein